MLMIENLENMKKEHEKQTTMKKEEEAEATQAAMIAVQDSMMKALDERLAESKHEESELSKHPRERWKQLQIDKGMDLLLATLKRDSG